MQYRRITNPPHNATWPFCPKLQAHRHDGHFLRFGRSQLLYRSFTPSHTLTLSPLHWWVVAGADRADETSSTSEERRIPCLFYGDDVCWLPMKIGKTGSANSLPVIWFCATLGGARPCFVRAAGKMHWNGVAATWRLRRRKRQARRLLGWKYKRKRDSLERKIIYCEGGENHPCRRRVFFLLL